MFQIKNFMHILRPLTYLFMAPAFMFFGFFSVPSLTQQPKHVFAITWELGEDGGGDGPAQWSVIGRRWPESRLCAMGHQFRYCSVRTEFPSET